MRYGEYLETPGEIVLPALSSFERWLNRVSPSRYFPGDSPKWARGYSFEELPRFADGIRYGSLIARRIRYSRLGRWVKKVDPSRDPSAAIRVKSASVKLEDVRASIRVPERQWYTYRGYNGARDFMEDTSQYREHYIREMLEGIIEGSEGRGIISEKVPIPPLFEPSIFTPSIRRDSLRLSHLCREVSREYRGIFWRVMQSVTSPDLWMEDRFFTVEWWVRYGYLPKGFKKEGTIPLRELTREQEVEMLADERYDGMDWQRWRDDPYYRHSFIEDHPELTV